MALIHRLLLSVGRPQVLRRRATKGRVALRFSDQERLSLPLLIRSRSSELCLIRGDLATSCSDGIGRDVARLENKRAGKPPLLSSHCQRVTESSNSSLREAVRLEREHCAPVRALMGPCCERKGSEGAGAEF